jgi:hypothetical protein
MSAESWNFLCLVTFIFLPVQHVEQIEAAYFCSSIYFSVQVVSKVKNAQCISKLLSTASMKLLIQNSCKGISTDRMTELSWTRLWIISRNDGLLEHTSPQVWQYFNDQNDPRTQRVSKIWNCYLLISLDTEPPRETAIKSESYDYDQHWCLGERKIYVTKPDLDSIRLIIMSENNSQHCMKRKFGIQ